MADVAPQLEKSRSRPPKKNIYQMQKAVDPSKIKYQNSWRVFKKMTISFELCPSCPYTELDFMKELAPKLYEELKENLADITDKSITSPLPFNLILKNPESGQEIEIRYILYSSFITDSRDYNYSIMVIDNIENIPNSIKRFQIETSSILVCVFLTQDILSIQAIFSEHPELRTVFFLFNLSNPRQSFEALRKFIIFKVFLLQENRMNFILNKSKQDSGFEALMAKPLRIIDPHINELAFKSALISNSKLKATFFQNLFVSLGRPPEAVFLNFKRRIETIGIKLLQEIPKASKRNPVAKPLESKISFASHRLTKREVQELALFVLEQNFFNSQRWKKDLFLYLGSPSEAVWKELRNEIDQKVLRSKASFEHGFKELYYKSKGVPINVPPRFHLGFFRKGVSLVKTQEINAQVEDYIFRHKFFPEVSKETLKIYIGNPEAGAKVDREVSELKQITLDLQAKLQRINDQRTTLAYLQQDFNPVEFKNKINVLEEAGALEKLRQNKKKNENCLIVFSETCAKSLDFVKEGRKILREKDGKVWRNSTFAIDSKRLSDLKAKIREFGARRLIFLISEDSWKNIQGIFNEILIKKPNSFKKLNVILMVFTPFHDEAALKSIETLGKSLAFNTIEDSSYTSIQKVIRILSEREKPIEDAIRANLTDFVTENGGSAIKNYLNFFDFINKSPESQSDLNQEIVQELFQNFFQLKSRSEITINELIDTLSKGLRKLEMAIEQREAKAFELKSRKFEILRKNEGVGNKPADYIALKISEIEGLNFEQNKLKKLFFWMIYGGYQTPPREVKSAIIKEKFLFPLEKNCESIEICLKTENGMVNESFIFKLTNREANEKIDEKLLSTKSPQVQLKTRLKLVNLENETLKINLKNVEKLIIGNAKFLDNIYKFKFDFHALLKQKLLPESVENPETPQVLEYQEKMEGKIRDFQAQIKENEEKLERLRSQQANPSNIDPASNLQSKEVEKQEGFSPEVSENLIRLREQRNARMIEELNAQIESQKKQLENMKASTEQTTSLKHQIVDFFNAALNADIPPADLLKLRDYFLYFQKSILKFYIKASLIEADLFELKKSSKTAIIKSGLSMIAGSVPFIGDILKTVVEKGVEIKEKLDEMKMVSKCTKFCVLVNSTEILSEILEECALQIIQDKEKQKVILAVEGFRENFWEKLKSKVAAFFKKAKEKLLGKGKEEKLMKDIDTPAKLLANIDAAYVCAHAATRLETQGRNLDKFDPADPYNKQPLIEHFRLLVAEIGPQMYEKVLDINSDKEKVEISMEKKTVQDLDKDIEKFTVKNTEACFEEIKRNNLDDEAKSQMPIQKLDVVQELATQTLSLEALKAKEREIESNLAKILPEKWSHREMLNSHDEKIKRLEESFDVIVIGSKAGTLRIKEVKDHATEVEFENNEKTKALTRTAEAIPEAIALLEKYKPILVKRKPLK